MVGDHHVALVHVFCDAVDSYVDPGWDLGPLLEEETVAQRIAVARPNCEELDLILVTLLTQDKVSGHSCALTAFEAASATMMICKGGLLFGRPDCDELGHFGRW